MLYLGVESFLLELIVKSLYHSLIESVELGIAGFRNALCHAKHYGQEDWRSPFVKSHPGQILQECYLSKGAAGSLSNTKVQGCQ